CGASSPCPARLQEATRSRAMRISRSRHSMPVAEMPCFEPVPLCCSRSPMPSTLSETAKTDIVEVTAGDIGVGPHHVATCVALSQEGAAYHSSSGDRKGATSDLNDTCSAS